jgi:DNA-binding PadR family transcriptional regulator
VPRRPNRSPQLRLLLSALLERPADWRYGYDLSKQTGLQSGTLYPQLVRLAEQGLLEHEWAEPHTSGRPPRHVYRLTVAGQAAAQALAITDDRPIVRRRRLPAFRPIRPI